MMNSREKVRVRSRSSTGECKVWHWAQVLYPLLYPLLYYPVPQEMEALLTFAAKTNPFIAEPLG